LLITLKYSELLPVSLRKSAVTAKEEEKRLLKSSSSHSYFSREKLKTRNTDNAFADAQ